MSLLPPSVTHINADSYYFPLAANGSLVSPVVVPAPVTSPVVNSSSASFTMTNSLPISNPDSMTVTHFTAAANAGGLLAGLYQIYMNGPEVGGTNLSQLLLGKGLGNGFTAMFSNNAGPLDATRMGKITGTGALQDQPCPSITSNSVVYLAFVGGTPAAADVVIAINANTNFQLTLPLGAVYNYQVVN